MSLNFGPNPISVGSNQGIIAVLIGLLLPAVQADQKQVMELVVKTADAKILIPLAAGEADKALDFRCYISRDLDTRSLLLNVLNLRTKRLFQAKTVSTSVGIQMNFAESFDVMGSATAHGFQNINFGDGSVQPIPIALLLPAVQKVREAAAR
ncbi:MAG TPA: hypothetical protein VGE01_14070 [Fimbriimonas sp.]